jgi:hypothetical protein
MYRRSLIFAALALILGCRCATVLADDNDDGQPGSGIHDVTDEELSTMRGRFTVGDNTVVWFGVEMISTLQTSNGQTVQSAMTLGMNFTKNSSSPEVTFVPTVTITTRDAPLPATPTVQSQVSRSVQSGGIANVGGLVQSVQIAGDNNATANVTRLNIQSGGNAPDVSAANAGTTTINTSSSTPTSTSTATVSVTAPMANTSSSASSTVSGNSGNPNTTALTTATASTTNTGTSIPTGRTATVGDATASSTYSGGSAEVTTSILGQGSATQWIHAGSLGQTIALTTDNAVVTNQMIVSLVTQQLSSTEQLAHTLTQSLNLSHLSGH